MDSLKTIIFFTFVFTSSQLMAGNIYYICWDNHSIPIIKNEVLFDLYPEFRSESEREQVFDNIRSELSDDIEFHLLYGFDRHGVVRLVILYDFDDIRVIMSTIENIEGIGSAEPNGVMSTGYNTQSIFPNTLHSINKIAQQGVFTDPEEHDFEAVRQPEVGCREVTVTNATDTIIHAQTWIEGFDSENFKILDGVSSFEIPPDSSKILELEFRPDSTRAFESVLIVAHDALNDQTLINVPLSGTGEPKTVSAESMKQVADHISLEQNYPNPFNPTTQIQFAITEPAYVHLAVYNTLGQNISILIDEAMSPGLHQVDFDARGLSSGIYIYRLETQGRILQRQMTLVK